MLIDFESGSWNSKPTFQFGKAIDQFPGLEHLRQKKNSRALLWCSGPVQRETERIHSIGWQCERKARGEKMLEEIRKMDGNFHPKDEVRGSASSFKWLDLD